MERNLMGESMNCRGRAVVVQPDEGPSYWQPTPANGHADPKLYAANTDFDGLSMGYQSVAPGGRVHTHAHDNNVELLICFSGSGRIMVDGEPHEFVPGTACFLGYGVTHEIINQGEDALVVMWIIMPGGLESFFSEVGRPRERGDTAPEPFERSASAPHHHTG
jgi:quercetin dioxygenase-like cupin family protein